MKFNTTLCIILLCCICCSIVWGEDADLFHTLFEQINNIVAPKFTSLEPYKMPQEIFLMSLPGQTINPDDYDEALWKANNYTESDPSYLSFNLVDSIPSHSSAYYTDSGKKVSVLYKRFLENYMVGNKKTRTSAEVERYKAALKRILKDDASPSNLAVAVNTTRKAAADTYASLESLRTECLNTKSASICARKAVLWGEEAQDKYLLYTVVQKELLAAQAKVMAVNFKSTDTMLMEAYNQYLGATRACVGAKSFMGDYLQTRFEPSDYWKWWRTNNDAPSFNSSFTSVKAETTYGTKTRSAILQKAFANLDGAYSNGLVEAISGSGSASKKRLKVTIAGSTTILKFDVAAVKVIRPWFDSSLFDLTPLGINGVPAFHWSDGRYKGVFPWFITKMIVAKNIYCYQSELSAQMQSAISTAMTEVSASVSIGPFVAGGALSKDSSIRDSSKQFTVDGTSITIQGPQIIGYVVSKISPFPNWDNSKYSLRIKS